MLNASPTINEITAGTWPRDLAVCGSLVALPRGFDIAVETKALMVVALLVTATLEGYCSSPGHLSSLDILC